MAAGTCQKVLLAFIFLIQANFLALAQFSCPDNGNYTGNNSTYRANLNTVFSTLSTSLDYNGFSDGYAGQGGDRVNAMILCRGDLQLDECRSCAHNASGEVLERCPNQKAAIIWKELCMLRYSDESIWGTLWNNLGWFVWNTENATSPEKFMADLRTLMDHLRGQAANGGHLRKVAAENVTGPDFQDIFGFVQCTPDLSDVDCYRCLNSAVADIPRFCDGKRGCRVLNPSCNLRFEIRSFYNEARLQELESQTPSARGPRTVPTPPPPPPRPQPPLLPPPPPGKGDANTSRIVIITVASIAACLILAILIGCLWRRKIKQRPEPQLDNRIDGVDVSISTTDESLQHTFSTIRAATNDFSEDNKLGQGGFGAVYKGILSNGQEIAVKRLSKNSGQGDLEFKNEVLLLARLQHRNLVRFLGFCIEGMEKLLVYEFVQHASLDRFIFGFDECSCPRSTKAGELGD